MKVVRKIEINSNVPDSRGGIHFGIVKLYGFFHHSFKKYHKMFSLMRQSVKSAYSAKKKDSNKKNNNCFSENWKQFQRKHEAMPLKISSFYAPRHFLASEITKLKHFSNIFHCLRHLRNIDFVLSCMDLLATNAQIVSD